MKSLFILFFSIFSLNLSSEAMAINVDIISSSTCSTSCNSITCPTAGTQHSITCAGAPHDRLTCAGTAQADVTQVINKCKTTCERCQQKIKMGSAYIEDAESNISKNAFTKTACNALRIVTGGAGKTFATFAVIATGIGFFTGKVSWGLMIGVAAGIATMFGGPSIVAAISGQDTSTMCNIQN